MFSKVRSTLESLTLISGIDWLYRTNLVEIREENTEWRRLRLNFPSIPPLCSAIKDGVFYEDLIADEQLLSDFLIPLRYINSTEIKVTEHLDLRTFYGAWRYLDFVGLVDIALRRGYIKNDPTTFLNSLARATDEEAMVEFIEGLGLSREQAREFLQVFSADVRGDLGYLDLQYRPALRIAQTLIPKEHRLTRPEMIYLPALLVTSNVLRNAQAANKFRVESNAKAFVDSVAQTLKSRFAHVETNRPVKGWEGATDIDVVVLEEDTLYLFECKHSLPPTGPHEMRDIWEEIEFGIHQLDITTKILSDTSRRQSYLTDWFPGTELRDTVGLNVIACVLCSDRIFSGFYLKGFPIRDFGSLARLCEDGIIGMGGVIAEDEVLIRQYRSIHDKTASARDLADYCSPDSVYFKTFRPFMHPYTRIERLRDMTIAGSVDILKKRYRCLRRYRLKLRPSSRA